MSALSRRLSGETQDWARRNAILTAAEESTLVADAAAWKRWAAAKKHERCVWLSREVVSLLERRSSTVRGKNAVKLSMTAQSTLDRLRAKPDALVSIKFYRRICCYPQLIAAPAPTQPGHPSLAAPAVSPHPRAIESPDPPQRRLRHMLAERPCEKRALPYAAAPVTAVVEETTVAERRPRRVATAPSTATTAVDAAAATSSTAEASRADAVAAAVAAVSAAATAAAAAAAAADASDETASVASAKRALKALVAAILNAKLAFPHMRKVRVLDLFCGTKSVLKALEKICRAHDIDFEYVSLDINAKFDPTHVASVEDWREVLSRYPPLYFDFIWVSPDCRKLSYANTAPTKAEVKRATDMVRHALQCIEYYDPPSWCVENPVGRLKGHSVMTRSAKYLHTVSYCMYGTSYRKLTNIWTNLGWLCTLRKCCKDTRCEWIMQGRRRHLSVAQHGMCNGVRNGVSREEAYVVPAPLMEILLGAGLANACEERKKQERVKVRERRERKEERAP
jgi:hypothetical protein